MRRRLASLLLLLSAAAPAAAMSQPASPELVVRTPADSDGLGLELSWQPREGVTAWAVLRAPSATGPWDVVTDSLPAGATELADRLTTDPRSDPPRKSYFYRLVALSSILPSAVVTELPAGAGEVDLTAAEDRDRANRVQEILAAGVASAAVAGAPRAVWLRTRPGSLLLLGLILLTGVLMRRFADLARRGREISIRRIPGIDAIEEGIGRATEMGRPVLYVPGVDELQDIQTIASMLILGQVSRTVAEYQSDIIVCCRIPIVREVADEVVRAGFFQAGHPDAFRSSDIRFISSEQFAFCAGTNGIILREQPATNLYLGRFFAESLILAETGFLNGSIQIAGTAEPTQLPFFIAACDYTLIGEELFAVSAYLSRDPRLVSSLKASDWIKVICLWALAAGTVLTTCGFPILQTLFTIGN